MTTKLLSCVHSDQECRVQFLENNAIFCYTSITKGCKPFQFQHPCLLLEVKTLLTDLDIVLLEGDMSNFADILQLYNL